MYAGAGHSTKQDAGVCHKTKGEEVCENGSRGAYEALIQEYRIGDVGMCWFALQLVSRRCQLLECDGLSIEICMITESIYISYLISRHY